MPAGYISIINYVISLAVAWLWLFRSPFAFWFSASFLFSFAFGYQYLVIARGYMLMLLIGFLIAELYSRRRDYPLVYGGLLALWFNSEAFAIVPAAVLGLLWAWEWFAQWRSPRFTFGLMIATAGAILSLLSLWPNAAMQEYYAVKTFFLPKGFFFRLYEGYWSETFWRKIADVRQSDVMLTAFCSFPVLFVFSAAAQLRGTRWFWVYGVTISWFCCIFIFLYRGYYWHSLLIEVFTLWVLWMWKSNQAFVHNRQRSQAVFVFLLLPMLAKGLYASAVAHYDDMQRPYSGAPEMARYIRDQALDGEVIVSVAAYQVSSVMAELPQTNFWISGLDATAKHVVWSGIAADPAQYINRITPALLSFLKQKEDPSLVLSTGAVNWPAELSAEELFVAQGMKESYRLYRVRFQ